MTEREKVMLGLECCVTKNEDGDSLCEECPYSSKGMCDDIGALVQGAYALLKAQEPRVMTLEASDADWHDRALWLEVKGKRDVTLCLFKDCGDRVLFGHWERMMRLDVIGRSSESGYMLKNYGVKWRCWTSRPTDEQREAVKWE